MYSPKIAEDLIPDIYRIGKEIGKPMTRIVDEILREKLPYYRSMITDTKFESTGTQI